MGVNTRFMGSVFCNVLILLFQIFQRLYNASSGLVNVFREFVDVEIVGDIVLIHIGFGILTLLQRGFF